jgi:hypothetical protein
MLDNRYIKNLVLILAVFSLLLFNGCASREGLVAVEEYDMLSQMYVSLEEEYSSILEDNQSITSENALLKEEIQEERRHVLELGKELEELEQELKVIEAYEESAQELSGISPLNLRKLLDSMNTLLGYAYIGSSTAQQYSYTFTAFSIEYKGRYYIVTAGHCVEDNYGEEGEFKFKANFSDEWIYPQLIDYKAEFWNLDDYAVFSGPGIRGGLPVSERKTPGKYLLGSADKGLSIFRNLGDSSKRGESGSAVINEHMEAIGIYVVYGYVYTPIQLVLEAIDRAG